MVDHRQIEAFNAISIHNRIDPFFEADIEMYLENDNEFSLDLKRSNKELSLYGAEHVALRRCFFNNLNQEQRLSLGLSKLKEAQIFEWALDSLKIKTSLLNRKY